MAQKIDLYQHVTDKVIAMIEAGAGDFEMPWTGPKGGAPYNATTKKAYRGINVLLLWAQAAEAGYRTNEWASYKQWQERRAQVRKGERGTMIVYYGTTDRTETVRDPSDGSTYEAERTVRFLRYSKVFNAAQVDGWQSPAVERPCLADRLDAAERFVASTGAVIRYDQGRAFYSRAGDFIGMPAWEQFKPTEHRTATEAAYGVLFHELTHWTGAEGRCEREFGRRFGDQAYAAEELVAELGAAFLCADLGIEAETRRDHAQYVASWLEVLRSDKKAIFTAASKASDAADFLRGLQAEKRAAA